ncbi:MAG: 30S ribosomal protein S16 [Gammaproteobacteria bacterium]|nr:30S ribosomal protein S16 [Gammaproteobacteria bacterium]MCH9716050.1 30S ribosomal protein S16 [Gammaproteobacteria bacterium]MCH9763481.1 30S ribosomal protein S16 [Gammaproteobacteria bacterium]
MVIIRLSRAGAKKRPFYHIVVTDSRRRRDSNYIESIGYFNPVARGQEVRLHLETERFAHWQGLGAQLSDRVKSLAKSYKAPAAKKDKPKEDKAA